jgi:hypothetical protein
LNPVGSELRNAVAIVPPSAKESDTLTFSITNVVEDITHDIEGVDIFSKFCTDTRAVIFINSASLHTFLLVRRLGGTA